MTAAIKSPQNISDLQKIANAHGWTYHQTRMGIRFDHPDDTNVRVFVNNSAEKSSGHAWENVIADLRRAGLPIPHSGGSPKPAQVPVISTKAPVTLPQMELVLRTTLDQLDELADQFRLYRESTNRKFDEQQRYIATVESLLLEVKPPAPCDCESKVRATVELWAEQFREQLNAVEQRIDPIKAFRERLAH